jgi:hypothetical protein
MKSKIFLVVTLLAAGFLCFGTEPNNDPNSTFNATEARMLALEKRLAALEQRVNRLELRRTAPPLPADEIPKVEGEQKKNRQTDPTSPTDETKDALRVQRLSKQIQEMKDDIELADKRIEMLPPIPLRYLGAHISGTTITTQTRTNENTSTSQTTTPGAPQTTTIGTSETFTRICELNIFVPEKHCDYRLHQDEVPEILEVLKTAKEAYRLLSEEEANYRRILQLGEKNSDLGINVMDAKKDLIECQGRKKIADLIKACIRSIIQDNRDLFNIVPW